MSTPPDQLYLIYQVQLVLYLLLHFFGMSPQLWDHTLRENCLQDSIEEDHNSRKGWQRRLCSQILPVTRRIVNALLPTPPLPSTTILYTPSSAIRKN